jgi:hypothetical protein
VRNQSKAHYKEKKASPPTPLQGERGVKCVVAALAIVGTNLAIA